MHHVLALSATILASIAGTNARRAVTFDGFPETSSYKDVSYVGTDGTCNHDQVKNFVGAGVLAEELAVVIRGPINLKQFAVYNLDSNSKRSEHLRRHAHHDFHARNQQAREASELEERAVGDIVHALINGEEKTWVNTYSGETAPPAAPASNVAAPAAAAAPAAPAADTAPPVKAGAGNWGRVAHYNAATRSDENVTFLANNIWPHLALGEILGFIGSDGVSSVASPEILSDVHIRDNQEIIIASGTPCQGGSCGAVSPDAKAYHGFGGDHKLFLFEFGMPLSGVRDGKNGDMPSVWLLNSRIVNTQEYGLCNCWRFGCGEWDIHEVTQPGALIGYTSLHMGKHYAVTEQGGFPRPVTGTIKMAAIHSGNFTHVQHLDDGVTFDEILTGGAVAEMINSVVAFSQKVTINPSDVQDF